MAKYKGMKKKDKVAVQIIYPNRKGIIDSQTATLEHNKQTDRYDLKIDGKLRYSGFHSVCIWQAKELGIDWEDKSNG